MVAVTQPHWASSIPEYLPDGGVRPIDQAHWLVYYRDGTLYPELDESGQFRSFNSVRHTDVVAIAMTRITDGEVVAMLNVPLGARAQFGRVRSLGVTISESGNSPKTFFEGSMTVLSWHLDEKDQHCWMYIRGDGLIAVIDREVA